MNNIPTIVITVARTKQEKQGEVVAALRNVAEAARAEIGCIEFRIFRAANDATITTNYERWSSNDARETFLAGPAVAAFVAAIDGAFTQAPEPVFYEEIG